MGGKLIALYGDLSVGSGAWYGLAWVSCSARTNCNLQMTVGAEVSIDDPNLLSIGILKFSIKQWDYIVNGTGYLTFVIMSPPWMIGRGTH